MRKKGTKKYLIVLVTMLALVLGYSTMPLQASASKWYGETNVKFAKNRIKKGNTTIRVKDKQLKAAIDDTYGAWSPYTKGKYVYVCPYNEDVTTFGTTTWAVNMSNGKVHKVSDSAISLMKIYGKHLYFVESSTQKAGSDFLVTFRVMRSTIMGKNKKQLKKVTVKGIYSRGVKLTNHKFVYYQDGGKNHSVKF